MREHCDPVHYSFRETGGADGARTHDLHNAIVALFQLSYDPSFLTVKGLIE